ncbi:MAG: hypothetical protein BWK74_03965 [Desulfobacteraceae bacterium A6]|nr:MAG: hypothetical protein BWK74_03965 [Desulfobacteraceae bacterium A6]
MAKTYLFLDQQSIIKRLCLSNNLALLPISWEKGVQDSRIQGFKCLFSNLDKRDYFQYPLEG